VLGKNGKGRGTRERGRGKTKDEGVRNKDEKSEQGKENGKLEKVG
jgi:hypothetical protein